MLVMGEGKEYKNFEGGWGDVEVGGRRRRISNARVIPPNADHFARLGFDRRHQLLGRGKDGEQKVSLLRKKLSLRAGVAI